MVAVGFGQRFPLSGGPSWLHLQRIRHPIWVKEQTFPVPWLLRVLAGILPCCFRRPSAPVPDLWLCFSFDPLVRDLDCSVAHSKPPLFPVWDRSSKCCESTLSVLGTMSSGNSWMTFATDYRGLAQKNRWVMKENSGQNLKGRYGLS